MTLKKCNFSKVTPKKKCRAEPEKVLLKGLSRLETCEVARIYQVVTNNQASFHL